MIAKHKNICIYTCNAPQESVRELAVENAVKMMSTLSPEEASRVFGSFVDNIQSETSRSMRLSKAKHFVELAKAMHPFRPFHTQVRLLHSEAIALRSWAQVRLSHCALGQPRYLSCVAQACLFSYLEHVCLCLLFPYTEHVCLFLTLNMCACVFFFPILNTCASFLARHRFNDTLTSPGMHDCADHGRVQSLPNHNLKTKHTRHPVEAMSHACSRYVHTHKTHRHGTC
jgi:hypothetical protein